MSDSTACRRTNAESLPLTSMITSGAMKPIANQAATKVPMCEASAQLRSSEVGMPPCPGWGAPAGGGDWAGRVGSS